MGSLIVNVLPFPGKPSLSTSIVPPLASTRFFEVANPNPIPRALVVNSGLKSFFIFSFEIPEPVSVIERVSR